MLGSRTTKNRGILTAVVQGTREQFVMNSLGIVFGAWGKGVICNGQSLNEGSTINASPSCRG